MIWSLIGIACAAIASLFFSTVTYALRDFSRSRLQDMLASYRRSEWFERTLEHRADLAFVSAVGRLLANLLLFMLPLWLFHSLGGEAWIHYAAAFTVAAFLGLIFSIVLPTALAKYAGEMIIAISVRFLHAMRIALLPVTRLSRLSDRIVRRITGCNPELEPEQLEKDILSAVEEGAKEGVVGQQEREMIESVIEFRDTNVDQTMTARPEIIAVELAATIEQIRHTIEETGHSRLPVYDGTLDHIVGILYARDLLKYVGLPAEEFDIRSVIRPVVFVPETKPLRDLLHEFKLQKVHIAIVLDEYGGTVGLVTIEDILEELVGEIVDEHEPHEPAMLKRLADNTFEADARLSIDELNLQCGLALPEDAGFETLGGFVVAVLGRIPAAGTAFQHDRSRFTVLAAEPQKVVRVKIDLIPQPATDDDANPSG